MRTDGNVRFPYYIASFLDVSALEDETSMFSRRVEHKLPGDTTPHPSRMESFPLRVCVHFRHIVQEMHTCIISVSQVMCNVKKFAYLIQNRVI
jgi:hypothetical protein